jgi:hypothetical protein
MDETKLLEDCVNIKLTPLQTILLSKTLIVTNTIIDFLESNHCMDIVRITDDNSIAPAEEQTGNILIKSALEAMKEVRDKTWESGRKEIGEEIPDEFVEVVDIYCIIMQEIAYKFVAALPPREV